MKPHPELAGYETAREWLEGLSMRAVRGTQGDLERVQAMLEAAAAVVDNDSDESIERLNHLMR